MITKRRPAGFTRSPLSPNDRQVVFGERTSVKVIPADGGEAREVFTKSRGA